MKRTRELVFEYLQHFMRGQGKELRMLALVSYDEDIVNGRFSVHYQYYKDFQAHRNDLPTIEEFSVSLLDYLTFLYIKAANYTPREL